MMAYISPCVADTDCIDLGLNADGELEANLIIAPSGGLECSPVGAAIKLDPDSCNGALLSTNGLWVPPVANSRLLTGGVSSAKAGVTGVSDSVLGVVIDWDSFEAAYGLLVGVDITNTASISLTNTSCYMWNIEVGWSMGPTQFKLRNGWLCSIGQNNTIVSPHLTASPTPGVSFDTVSDPLASSSVAIGVGYPPTDYYAQTYLNPGESATVSGNLVAQVDAQGEPDGGVGCGSACNQSLILFGLTIRLYAWSREP